MPDVPDSPLSYEYLGENGITQPCVNAMVAILTSPYRPEKITVVFLRKAPDQTTTDVCFVVWNWLSHKPTIVADGFGTHHGEGGRGFATVCDLIRQYEIPLFAYTAGREQFRRIAYGAPHDDDLEQVRSARPASSFRLPSLATDFGKQLWQDEPLLFTTPIPYWMIEPELHDDLTDMERNPGGAVFQVARRLEMLLREACQLPSMLTGEVLLHQALTEHKPLALKGETTAEVESWFRLFEGALGAFKEPHTQRSLSLSRDDALAQILTINLLLRKLKQDHPERFPQSSRGHTRRRF